MNNKKTNKFLSIVIAVCIAVGSAAFSASAEYSGSDPFSDSVFENYITRKGSVLYDGDEVFRSCVGFADAGLVSQEDGGHHMADEFEIRDAFETMKQLGQNSTRTGWPFCRQAVDVNGNTVGEGKPGEEVMIEGPGKYNEYAFRAMDKMLQLANEYGIRLFIPVLSGSMAETFSAYRSVPAKDFYNNLQLIEDTKALFTYMLNRTNYYTGVKYKDDPAVMAWQIGNELDRSGCTTEWVNIISAHIKSIDQNHLVAAPQTYYWKDVVNDPNIDIVDTHIYDAMPFKDMVQGDIAVIDGKKALILGELGMKNGDFFSDDFLPWVAQKPQVCAAYMFMLGAHNSLGGIYCHSSGTDYPNLVYPGYDDADEFASTSGKWNPKHLFESIKKINYGKMGIDVPEIPKPRAPHLLPVTNVHDIWWRGSTGAQFYDIERAESESGPWTLIAENVQDNKQYRYRNFSDGVFRTLFDDSTAEDGKTYYYRVKAKTEKGVESDWSNVRKSGDATLDAILQAEKDADDNAHSQPLIEVEIPKVDGELDKSKPEIITRANLPEKVRNQLYKSAVIKAGSKYVFAGSAVLDLGGDVPYAGSGGEILVPLDLLPKVFDCTVDWDEATQTAAVLCGLYSLSMQIGSYTMTVKDEGVAIQQPAQLKGKTVFVPLRAVCEKGLQMTVAVQNGVALVYDGNNRYDYESNEFWQTVTAAFDDPVSYEYTESQAEVDGNVITNGGFESGDTSDGWFAITPNDRITSQESHSGNYSLLTAGSGVWSGPSARINLKANTDYIFSFYYKAPKALRGKYALGIQCRVVDNYTKHLSSTVQLKETEGWKHEVVTFNSGSTTSAMYRFSVIWGGAYIDDVVIVEANSPEGNKILSSYGRSMDFESLAEVDGSYKDAVKGFIEPTQLFTEHINWDIAEDPKNSGNTVLKVTGADVEANTNKKIVTVENTAGIGGGAAGEVFYKMRLYVTKPPVKSEIRIAFRDYTSEHEAGKLTRTWKPLDPWNQVGLVNINCPNVDNRRIQLAYTDASGANQTFDAKDASGVKATWKFDTWYDIDVRINTASQTYRVYFNGKPLRDSDGNADIYLSDITSKISGMRIQNQKGGDIYIDDISLGYGLGRAMLSVGGKNVKSFANLSAGAPASVFASLNSCAVVGYYSASGSLEGSKVLRFADSETQEFNISADAFSKCNEVRIFHWKDLERTIAPVSDVLKILKN